MMITKKQIDAFFEQKKVAVAGASRNPKKFGYQVYKTLQEKGITAFPVNPHTDEIDGQKCYRDIASLPPEVASVVILTKKDQTEKVVKEALQKGIKNIWIQQMAQTPEALKAGQDGGINLIHGKCIMMFAEPVGGVHKFHRSLMKLFGKLPK